MYASLKAAYELVSLVFGVLMHVFALNSLKHAVCAQALASGRDPVSVRSESLYTPNLFRQIVPPALPSTVLHRANLIAALREALLGEREQMVARTAKKLVLLCAPAGYGKTTLLADFAVSAPIPCCWYFLERADTDAVLFLHTLLNSLCVAFPRLNDSLSAVFTNQFVRDTSSSSDLYHAVIDALCNTITIEISERFALFLCNYEQINESETLTDLINYLLSRLPSQAVLVIESRSLPRIELAQLIVRDELFAIDSNTLRFSSEEISELARLHGSATLTPADAEQLAVSFDGWITGILLGTYLGDLRFLPTSQATFPRSTISFLRENTAAARKRKNLFAYVAREVFQRDQALYGFLQPSSILQQMEAEMCDALLGIHDAAELLSRLEQQGLFVSSYESENQIIYICHPVIRDLLNAHLRQQDQERFLALHRKAAELWHTCLNYEQAMYHALKAHDYDLAIQLILEVYKEYLRQRRLDTLTYWLQALPLALKEHSPRLLLIEGAVTLAQGKHASASPLLEKISVLLVEQASHYSPAEIERWQAEVHILRSRALYQIGEYFQAQNLCLQTLQTLPEQEVELRAEAKLRVGICATLLGDFSSGVFALQEVLYNWHHQLPKHQIADIHGVLVNAYYLTGNFLLAEYHLDRALNYCEQLHDEQGKVDNLIRRGILSREQGRYTEAEADLQEALSLVRGSVSARGSEPHVLANLGFLQLEQGMYAQALTLYEHALEMAYNAKNQHLVQSILPNVSLAQLLLGDPSSALVWLHKIELPSGNEERVNYELAERELTYALILLYQQRYDEAFLLLVKIEETLSQSGLQQELMIARLRLAACQLARGQKEEVVVQLVDITRWLEEHIYYTHLVQVQLQWLPALLQIVRSLLPLARLREMLSLELAVSEIVDTPQATMLVASPQLSLPKLTIRAFGEPTVLLNDQPIKHWRMARAMELFFFLLNAKAPVSKESIITELWPEFDERINQTFHSTLHQLRKLLGESCFVFLTNGYYLDLATCYGENVWYDVQEFCQLRSEATRALSTGEFTVAQKAFLRMVELYQGDYGRPFSNRWCSLQRDELCTFYLDAHHQLAQLAWQDQAYDESIHHWRCILTLDNCREDAHYNIMLCYLRQAKRGAALRQYQLCRETLQEELGIEPGEAIENLHRDLKMNSSPFEAR